MYKDLCSIPSTAKKKGGVSGYGLVILKTLSVPFFIGAYDNGDPMAYLFFY